MMDSFTGRYSSKTFALIKLLLLLVCCVLVASDTVHFTNSRSRVEKSLRALGEDVNTKTYKLDVPGSRPITIIEADPQNGPPKISEDRKTKDYIVPGSTHEKDLIDDSSKRAESGRCLGPSCHEFVSNKKTVYSPDLLNKFLNEYADKIKNADEQTKQRLQQIQMSIQADMDSSPTADAAYQKNKITEKIGLHLQSGDENPSSHWDRPVPKRQKYPFSDESGWVTMEAVPWSKSKISKWKANSHKISKPSNTYIYNNDRDPSIDTDRFSSPGYGYARPEIESEYDSRPYGFDRPSDRPSNRPSDRPSNRPDVYNYRPTSFASQPDNDWPYDAPNRPSRPVPSFDNHKNCDHDDHNYDYDNRRISAYYQSQSGIITDGQPGDFPSYNDHQEYVRPAERPSQTIYVNSKYPPTHPSTGDGEWVLLSTTKGYQFPKKRQRSLAIAPHSVSAHRSVKLTVLPAVDGSKENMTTSHGGMLEVEPSFHTVEESRKMHENEELRRNATRLKRIKMKQVMATDSSVDGSAVMAAVGAGLVPATVAMIMPMVLGRKKRSVYRKQQYRLPIASQNVTQYPHFDYESTLQRNI